MSSVSSSDTLPAEAFRRLAALVEERIGIRLPPSKKSLVESRLRRRVRDLGLGSLREYARECLAEGSLNHEFPQLINALTTNKTDFFREPSHFQLLIDRVVPDMLARQGIGRLRPLVIWSAACSIGAEPYTIAMVLAEYARSVPEFRFSILGLDIDSDALGAARRAIYDSALLSPIPDAFRHRYILRAKNSANRTFRIVPEVRRLIRFESINLLAPEWPENSVPDVIFCRNVLIYFNRENQQRALDGLCQRLRPGGVLFVGHSESLHGLSLPVRPLAPAAYQRL